MIEMTDYEKLGQFYLGKRKDDGSLLLYESKDLVTHAVCVGMTGSGKTGLCIGLLEEAAIDGIPALVIDPKGDLANLMLTFPNLQGADFEPWVNEDEARTKGVDRATFASQQAELWTKGLAGWQQDGTRIQRLKDAADFCVYTPGSDAGVPISILRSFAAPGDAVMSDRELLRDRISATATSLLGLVGIDADPVQSKEHVLLSTILDTAWRKGEDLDLAALIGQIQKPPFTKVGVMDLNSFYPEKERFGLAMALNNLLASPGFEAWLSGVPLDIDKLLFTANGKPRIAILSIAHLGDAERMFFVSLLLNQTLSWVRAQSGTTSLRAILYMDEIFGYFPPVANPPSKKPLLTLLKQARAFGLGVVLATQNPVDLDYKGLANTGTWFIGRLQTERDKARVLEGLEGAATEAAASFDKARMEQLLAGLGKRVFLMNNVHEKMPVLFETRWTLSYLRGPLARTQIKALMANQKSAGDGAAAAGLTAASGLSKSKAGGVAPVLPPEIPQYFIPARDAEPEYTPMIVGSASVQFVDDKKGVDETREVTVLAPIGDDAVGVNWDESTESEYQLGDLEQGPSEKATFADLPSNAAKPKNYAKFQKDFGAWIFRAQKIDLLRSPSLSVLSNAGETERDFRIRLQQTAREQRDLAVQELRDRYASKIATLQERRRKAEQAREKEKQESSGQVMDTVLTVGGSILGVLFGRKGVSARDIGKASTAVKSISRVRKQSSDVDRADENIEAIDQQIQAIEQEIEAEAAEIQKRMDPATEELESISVRPKKTNINVKLVALVWNPE